LAASTVNAGRHLAATTSGIAARLIACIQRPIARIRDALSGRLVAKHSDITVHCRSKCTHASIARPARPPSARTASSSGNINDFVELTLSRRLDETNLRWATMAGYCAGRCWAGWVAM
jgi:hypothetical protein